MDLLCSQNVIKLSWLFLYYYNCIPHHSSAIFGLLFSTGITCIQYYHTESSKACLVESEKSHTSSGKLNMRYLIFLHTHMGSVYDQVV